MKTPIIARGSVHDDLYISHLERKFKIKGLEWSLNGVPMKKESIASKPRLESIFDKEKTAKPLFSQARMAVEIKF
jgi:hypothetical protein